MRKLEISFAALAANSQWMADNQNKTVHPPVTTQEKDDKDIYGTVNQMEKMETSAVHDAAAIATGMTIAVRHRRPRRNADAAPSSQMSKLPVNKDQIERLIVGDLKSFPGCEAALGVVVVPVLAHGATTTWTVSCFNGGNFRT